MVVSESSRAPNSATITSISFPIMHVDRYGTMRCIPHILRSSSPNRMESSSASPGYSFEDDGKRICGRVFEAIRWSETSDHPPHRSSAVSAGAGHAPPSDNDKLERIFLQRSDAIKLDPILLVKLKTTTTGFISHRTSPSSKKPKQSNLETHSHPQAPQLPPLLPPPLQLLQPPQTLLLPFLLLVPPMGSGRELRRARW